MSHWKVIAFYLAVFDVIAVNASYFLALWLRFDARYSNIPQEYLHAFLQFAPFYTIFMLLVFLGLRLYNVARDTEKKRYNLEVQQRNDGAPPERAVTTAG